MCKCTETVNQIRGQQTVKIQWSMSKHYPSLRSLMMSSSWKFILDLISGLSANVRKLLNTNQRSGNGPNSVKHDQKLIKSGETVMSPCSKFELNVISSFYPAALKAPGYCRTPSGRAGGRAAGQTSPVNTLTSIIFHGSFSNLARTFIVLRSRTSSIMEVLPH